MIWMTDICDELNRAEFELADYHGKANLLLVDWKTL